MEILQKQSIKILILCPYHIHPGDYVFDVFPENFKLALIGNDILVIIDIVFQFLKFRNSLHYHLVQSHDSITVHVIAFVMNHLSIMSLEIACI